jgi:hypothetical protein
MHRLASSSSFATLEAALVFHSRSKAIALSLGLFGSTVSKRWSVDAGAVDICDEDDSTAYHRCLQAGRHDVQSLSVQVGLETKLASERPDLRRQYETKAGLGSLNGNGVVDAFDTSNSAESLQKTLKLSYLFLEFARQLVKTRELIAITNTNTVVDSDSDSPLDREHPLDAALVDVRAAQEHVRHVDHLCRKFSLMDSSVSSLVDSAGDGGGVGSHSLRGATEAGVVMNRGVESKILFFHSISAEDFVEFFTVLASSSPSSYIGELGGVLINSLVCLLRLVGQYNLSEPLVAMAGRFVPDRVELFGPENGSKGMQYISQTSASAKAVLSQNKTPDVILLDIFKYLISMTIRPVVEAAALAQDSFSISLARQLEGYSGILSRWDIIPGFFTSHQQQHQYVQMQTAFESNSGKSSLSTPKNLSDDEEARAVCPCACSSLLGISPSCCAVLQAMGSTVVHLVGVLRHSNMYATHDVQVNILASFVVCIISFLKYLQH